MAHEEKYISKSGTEISAVINGKKFGSLQMVKFGIQRDMVNNYVMGVVDAVSVSKGKRGVSGACIFLIFERDLLLDAVQDRKVFLTHHERLNYGNDKDTNGINNRLDTKLNPALQAGGSIRDTSAFNGSTAQSVFSSFGYTTSPKLIDQVPPFDIILVGISESSGHGSRMIIHGVQFNSDQGGTSIDDMNLERQTSFLARRVTPWEELKELANGMSATI